MNQSIKTSYKRIGECDSSKCGAFCCKLRDSYFLIFNSLKEVSNYKELPFKIAQGYTIESIKFEDGLKLFFYKIDPCAFLKDNKCACHSNIPLVCTEFPSSPEQEFFKLAKLHGCTYDFIEVKKCLAKKKKK